MSNPAIPPGSRQPSSGAAPGWYPVPPYGQQRWWDGYQWGPFAGTPAPQPLTPSDANMWASLSHACFFVLAIIGPAIIRATKGKIVTGSPAERYLRQQSNEALNFQISFMIVWTGGIFLMIFGIMGMAFVAPPMAAIGGVVVWIVLIGAYVGGLVYAILAIVRCSSGQPWRYPINFRFFKD